MLLGHGEASARAAECAPGHSTWLTAILPPPQLFVPTLLAFLSSLIGILMLCASRRVEIRPRSGRLSD